MPRERKKVLADQARRYEQRSRGFWIGERPYQSEAVEAAWLAGYRAALRSSRTAKPGRGGGKR